MYIFAYLAYHLTSLMSLPRRRSEAGASAVEYGLLVALIAAIIVGVVAALGTTVSGAFTKAETGIDPAA